MACGTFREKKLYAAIDIIINFKVYLILSECTIILSL